MATTNGVVTNGTHADTTEEGYSLLPKLLPHLDRHLVFPILEFLEASDPDVKPIKYTLLKETNMSDYVSQLYCELHNLSEPPADQVKRREEVIEKKTALEETTARLTGLLDDEQVSSQLRSDKVANLNWLKENYGVQSEDVSRLLEFGQFLYSLGDYGGAADTLFQFRILSTDNDAITTATWGKLASEILQANWDAALEEISKLRESIDTRLFNAPLSQLNHRSWLLHWSLFPLFHHPEARDTLIDMFFSASYINTIQTNCPWLLRYLAAAVISGRGKGSGGDAKSKTQSASAVYQKQVKDLTRVVRQEGYEYTDPITSFIRALYIDFDFTAAQQHLTTAHGVLASDFFTQGDIADAFVEAARHLISESYCKIHQRIDISELSGRLGLSQEEGEKWIVNLIRDTRVDAKIDYQKGTVLMNHPPMSVYQQVIERTKGGFFRTQVLNAAVAGK
ncbi:MAG: hypothetical protein Q9162_006358 [Coniocarpon cinnabarinum]